LRGLFESELDAKIFDVRTPDSEVRVLREVRRRLVSDWDVRKIAESLASEAS
jgi:hypothetical protein